MDDPQQAMDVTLDVVMLLVRDIYCFAEAHSSIAGKDLKPPNPLPKDLAASPHVQWLLSCHAAMTAQSLYKQQRGRSMAVPLAPGSSKRQQQQQQEQQQQQQMKVAAVHKRLLEGLGVPALVGIEYQGREEHLGMWANATAYPAIVGCHLCDGQEVYQTASSSSISNGRGHLQQQQQQQLLTPTVHLRRAAVLLELCLLDCRIMPLIYGLQCLRKEITCLHKCLLRELQGDSAAACVRANAAVASGLLPALLQQLPAAMQCAVQCAQEMQQAGDVQGKCSRAVKEMAVLLAEVLTGEVYCVKP
jgi:hypothetical protein